LTTLSLLCLWEIILRAEEDEHFVSGNVLGKGTQ